MIIFTIYYLLMIFYMIYVLYMQRKQMNGGNFEVREYQNSAPAKKPTIIKSIIGEKEDETSNDDTLKLDKIIGLESVKKELQYYMDFIKNKDKYKKWNVKLPKGILLVGPPGTGKTLLVKTLAKEINIPVIHSSGSEFVEMYVGVGAARVRKLFKRARGHPKGCIIFIDEIDAIGKKRANGHEGNSERDNTLNQLLVELDGFGEDDNIMVFGATNLVKNLDSALMRSGRFDKKVFFDPPNKEERTKMFDLYLKNIKDNDSLDDNVELDKLSELTSQLNGADIANICNQSKINAIQDLKEKINMDHLQKAIDEVMIGREKPERKMEMHERERVAYHEAGHAIMGYILKHSSAPIKVSILPRGENALGFSQPKPEDRKLLTQDFLIGQVSVLLGGRVAEKIMYDNYSSGAHDDIERATKITKEWFCTWGMDAETGPINYDVLFSKLSDDMLNNIKKFIKSVENFTLKTLQENKEHLIGLGKLLLDKETIVYDDIKGLLPTELENSIEKIEL